MSREEFEGWLTEHMYEALDRIDTDRASLGTWLKLYMRAMKNEAEDSPHVDDLADFDFDTAVSQLF
jgi:hypothetical protein